ncbi:MAG: sulfotransferase family 2 domain-containing protein [Pseudomonadota bacterium]
MQGSDATSVEIAQPAHGQTRIFYTTQRYPIYYLAITKCGCTYLKNLFHALDHGVPHPDGAFVHETESGLTKARDVPPEVIRASPYAFAVLREPGARFLSFYFDKIYGEGPQNFPEIRAHLSRILGLDLSPDLDVEGHRRNCLSLIDWVGRNLRGETDRPKNYHWRPQAARLRRARGYPLTYLTLPGLDWQLPQLLAPVIPDLAERMRVVEERNSSPRPVDPRAVRDGELEARIAEVYGADAELYARAEAAWAGQGAVARARFWPATPPLARGVRAFRAAQLPVYLRAVTPRGVLASRRWLTAADAPALSADVVPEEEAVRRALVEDPVDRLLFAYADGLLRPRPGAVRLQRALVSRRGFTATPEGVQDHRTNLEALVRFIEIRRGTLTAANGLLRAQSAGLSGLDAAGFALTRLDRAALLLRGDLADHAEALPGLGRPLSRIGRPVRAALTAELEARIRAVYRADQELYDRAEADPSPAAAD